jgi:glucose-6-phosphate isomerase
MNLLMQTSAWPALRSKAIQLSRVHLRNFFEQDAERFKRYSFAHGGWLIDYSKQRVDEETMSLLLELTHALDLPRGIRALMAGDQVNFTERRAALHTALRAQDGAHAELVRDCRGALEHWVTLIRNRQLLGATGQTITHIVNLGIGGSELGPRLALEALEPQSNGPVVHFVANIDPAALDLALRDCKPAHTAFVLSSKSFTTQETLANARVAMKWLADGSGQRGRRAASFRRHQPPCRCTGVRRAGGTLPVPARMGGRALFGMVVDFAATGLRHRHAGFRRNA